MSYLLFQISLVVYFAAMSTYIVFFVSQKNNVRLIARKIFLAQQVHDPLRRHCGAVMDAQKD